MWIRRRIKKIDFVSLVHNNENENKHTTDANEQMKKKETNNSNCVRLRITNIVVVVIICHKKRDSYIQKIPTALTQIEMILDTDSAVLFYWNINV